MEPLSIAVFGAGAEAIDKTDKIISGLERIMKWIMIQPPEAAAELGSVIAEVMKAPEVINYAVDTLFKVIDEAKPRLETLAQIGDGSLVRKVQERRPHCDQIGKIADRHLSQWLRRPKDPDAKKLRKVLDALVDADDKIFKELVTFAEDVQSVANRAAELAIQGEQGEALTLLASAAPALFAARKKANALALQLTVMQTKFRRRALGLPPK